MIYSIYNHFITVVNLNPIFLKYSYNNFHEAEYYHFDL